MLTHVISDKTDRTDINKQYVTANIKESICKMPKTVNCQRS